MRKMCKRKQSFVLAASSLKCFGVCVGFVLDSVLVEKALLRGDDRPLCSSRCCAAGGGTKLICFRSLQKDQSQHHHQRPLQAETRSVSGGSLRARRARVAGIALALEIITEPRQLLLVHLPAHGETVLAQLKFVRASAQVQKGVRVRVPAQASPMPFTQMCAALLGRIGDVEEVAAEGADAEVLAQVVAVGLHIRTKHNTASDPKLDIN